MQVLNSVTNVAPVEVSADVLSRVAALYDEGRYVSAYRVSQEAGPLEGWLQTDAQVLAGRLIRHLGAGRKGALWLRMAWRSAPAHPTARYYAAYALFGARGPFAAWLSIQKHGLPAGADARRRSDWFGLLASLHGHLRDFERAEDYLARAKALDADHPWLYCEEADVLEQQDRFAESLEAAKRACALQPWFRPGVQAEVRALTLLDRVEEAMALLSEAADRLECAGLVAHLGILQEELGLVREARESWERYAALSPCLDERGKKFLSGRRSDTAYLAGEFELAATLARAGGPFHLEIADGIAERTDGKRVLLPVTFVRQHHMTCSPACMAMLGGFWSRATDHMELIDAICYDGTPGHRQRQWAEQNGWSVREFTVTPPTVYALIDAGVPFLLTTMASASAHQQVVIGYDSRRGTLLLRDPMERIYQEVITDLLIEAQQFCGPRGFVMVPEEEGERLAPIEFPDAALYDQLYAVERALWTHDREAAQTACDGLQAAAPDHRIAISAARNLAIYDVDAGRILIANEALLKLYPETVSLQLSKLSCLQERGTREERLAYLERISFTRVGSETETAAGKERFEPILWQTHADELALDARQHDRAATLLRRAIRFAPTEPSLFLSLANLHWNQRKFDEALAMYRFATCLGDKDEGNAKSYFLAARSRDQTEVVLALLRDRFARLRDRSPLPGQTLLWAYSQLDRTKEAEAVLAETIEHRPDDGDLRLYAAEHAAQFGRFEAAKEHLERAEGHVAPIGHLITRAQVAWMATESHRALDLFREALEIDPRNSFVQRAVGRLLLEVEGPEAAQEHLRASAKRFPFAYPLHVRWIEWLVENDDVAAAEAPLRALIARDPSDSWARRELALALTSLNRLDEALEEAQAAYAIEPTSASSPAILGRVHQVAGREEAARARFKEAISLSVDASGAVRAYVLNATAPRESLADVQDQLIQQRSEGLGLLVYQDLSRGLIEPDAQTAFLQKHLEVRPDLWASWSVLITHLTDQSKFEEAIARAEEALERFPLRVGLLFDLARARRLAGDVEGERAALGRVRAIEPSNADAVRMLAEAHLREGDLDGGKAVLEKALEHSPQEVAYLGLLGHLLWLKEETAEAVEVMERVVRIQPRDDAAWSALFGWCEKLGQSSRVESLVHDLTTKRPNDPDAWLRMARLLPTDRLDDRLAAIAKAEAIAPRDAEPHDLRAELLVEAQRFDEALAAATPTVFGGEYPTALLGRAAWILELQGEHDQAVARMRNVLAANPTYYWGWSELSSWARAHEEPDLHLECAEQLVKLLPQDAQSLSHLGSALLMLERRDEARDAFNRALQVAPDFWFAGKSLLDLHIDDERYEEADRVLTIMRAQSGEDAYLMAREVELASAWKKRKRAMAAITSLGRTADADPLLLQQTALLCRQAGWARGLEQVWNDLIDDPAAHPEVGAEWAAVQAAALRWPKLFGRLPKLLARGPIGSRAASVAIERAAETGVLSPITKLRLTHADALRESPELWASMGYAYLTAGLTEDAVRWMHDWKTFPGAEPWMLLNLTIALQQLGRTDDAARVSAHALTLVPDGSHGPHALWVALERGLSGNGRAAIEHLELAEGAELDAFHTFVGAMAEATIVSCSGDFRGARQRLASARRDHQGFASATLLRALHTRAARHAAQQDGGLLAYLWCWIVIFTVWAGS